MKNKIKKRLVKINGFLKSNKKPTLKIIHLLRLDVKHLEAFLELMTIQNNFAARSEFPGRLEKLFHESGKQRMLDLEMNAILSITKNKRISRPTLFIEELKFSKKKSIKKLHKKRRLYHAFKLKDFAKHPGAKLSSHAWQLFLAARASSILDLLTQDIISDIRSLHQLRKILKSILYVIPFCKKGNKDVRVFLKSHRKLISTVESKIGSLHDTDLFVNSLEKNHKIIRSHEQEDLRKIKQVWHSDIRFMTNDLLPLLNTVRQFAFDLKDKSTDDLISGEKVLI